MAGRERHHLSHGKITIEQVNKRAFEDYRWLAGRDILHSSDQIGSPL